MRNVFNHLLVVLCIADILVILSSLALAVKTLNSGSSLLPNQLVVLSDGVSHIAVSSSVFITISITVERYIAIRSPFTYQARVAEKGHCRILSSYIIPVILIAIVLNTPKILSIGEFISINDISPDYKNIFIKVCIISQVFHPLTTTCLVPIILLSVLNYKIHHGSKRMVSSRLKNEVSLSKVMMTIVIVFIVLSIPRMSLALYEVSTIPNIVDCHKRMCTYYISSGRWVADIFIRYLVLLNSSANFIIYCFVGTNFRKVLLDMTRKVLRKRNNTQNNDNTTMEISHINTMDSGIISSNTMDSVNIMSNAIENFGIIRSNTMESVNIMRPNTMTHTL